MSATSALTAQFTSRGLVRVLADEYTPGSVAENPTEATRLGLVRAEDGNYKMPPLAAFGVLAAAAARSSSGVQAGLYGFRLGG